MAVIRDDNLRLSLIGRWSDGQQIVNTMDYRITAESFQLGSTSLIEDVRDVKNAWQDHIVPGLAGAYSFEGVNYVYTTADGEIGYEPADPSRTMVGGAGGDGQAPLNVMLVHKNVAARRGSRKGRWFLSGLIDSVVDPEGNIDAQHLNLMQGRLDDFMESITSSPPLTFGDAGFMQVLHKNGLTASQVTSLTLDPRASHLDRRYRRR